MRYLYVCQLRLRVFRQQHRTREELILSGIQPGGGSRNCRIQVLLQCSSPQGAHQLALAAPHLRGGATSEAISERAFVPTRKNAIKVLEFVTSSAMLSRVWLQTSNRALGERESWPTGSPRNTVLGLDRRDRRRTCMQNIRWKVKSETCRKVWMKNKQACF